VPKPLCGAIPAPPDYIIPEGSAVAAKTAKANNKRPAEWLLATVVRYIPDKQKYEVVDADPDEDLATRKRYVLPRKSIIPLPTSVPESWVKETQFSKGTLVLAMFPNTTAFYLARVEVGPRRRKDKNYVLIFEDDEEDGRKCKRYVAPRFVVQADSSS
jgi:SAGA-associated factor 29